MESELIDWIGALQGEGVKKLLPNFIDADFGEIDAALSHASVFLGDEVFKVGDEREGRK